MYLMSNIYNLDNISKVIRETRKAIGISQEQLSKECSVARSTVIKWEQGKIEPDMHSLLTMCNLFDCELGYLLGEEGYEDGKRTVTDICKVTGLSRLAVDNLIKIKNEDALGDNTLEIDLDFITFLLEHSYRSRWDCDSPNWVLNENLVGDFLYEMYMEAEHNYKLHLLNKFIDISIFKGDSRSIEELNENDILEILFRGVLNGKIHLLKEGVSPEYDFEKCIEEAKEDYGDQLNEIVESYGRFCTHAVKKYGEEYITSSDEVDEVLVAFADRSNHHKNLAMHEIIRRCVIEDWSGFEFKKGEEETILYYMYFADTLRQIDSGFRRYKMNEMFILTMNKYKDAFIDKRLEDKKNG